MSVFWIRLAKNLVKNWVFWSFVQFLRNITRQLARLLPQIQCFSPKSLFLSTLWPDSEWVLEKNWVFFEKYWVIFPVSFFENAQMTSLTVCTVPTMEYTLDFISYLDRKRLLMVLLLNNMFVYFSPSAFEDVYTLHNW